MVVQVEEQTLMETRYLTKKLNQPSRQHIKNMLINNHSSHSLSVAVINQLTWEPKHRCIFFLVGLSRLTYWRKLGLIIWQVYLVGDAIGPAQMEENVGTSFLVEREFSSHWLSLL